jgi:hypothetical protein
VKTVNGEEVTLDVKDKISWKEMQQILHGLLEYDDRGKVKIDAMAIADRAIKVLVRHNGKEVDSSLLDGSDIFQLVMNEIIPLIFPGREEA